MVGPVFERRNRSREPYGVWPGSCEGIFLGMSIRLDLLLVRAYRMKEPMIPG